MTIQSINPKFIEVFENPVRNKKDWKVKIWEEILIKIRKKLKMKLEIYYL